MRHSRGGHYGRIHEKIIGVGATGRCWRSLQESDHCGHALANLNHTLVDMENCKAFKLGNVTTRVVFYKDHYRGAREWI